MTTQTLPAPPVTMPTPATRRPRRLLTGLLVVAMLVVPLVTTPQWQAIWVFAAIAAIAAIGLHVLTGLAGQVSLGHAAFVAVGGYTAIWLGEDRGLPLWVWLPAAGIASAAVGLLVVPFAARLRGLYLSVVTLAVLFVTDYIWNTWEGLTGGTNGRSAQTVELFGHDCSTTSPSGPSCSPPTSSTSTWPARSSAWAPSLPTTSPAADPDGPSVPSATGT